MAMMGLRRIILGILFLIGFSTCGTDQSHRRPQPKAAKRSKGYPFKLHVLSRDILGIKEIQFSREPGDRALYLTSTNGTRLWRFELDDIKRRTKDKQTKVTRRKILLNGDKYYYV